jgi:hypothetical protein
MKYPNRRYIVSGTSALKPDCSRYSNENEHIIVFPGAGHYIEQQVDYEKVLAARHLSNQSRLRVRCSRFFCENETFVGVRTGELKGTAFGRTPLWKAFVAGGVYSAMALVALLITM